MRKRVDLWYPRVDDCERSDDQPTEVEIELIDVRAANSVVVDYDFERNGYRIRMSTVFEFRTDDPEKDEGLVEVAFVPAWVPGAGPHD